VPTETCTIDRGSGPAPTFLPLGVGHVGDAMTIIVRTDQPRGAVREVVLTIVAPNGSVLVQAHLTDPTEFTYWWDTRGQQPGMYTISAQAFDTANQSGPVTTMKYNLLPAR
jgi:hypothetical protein